MSTTLPTIWMNVTTSANWKRPPVGIVRVERSLCSEFGMLYSGRFRQCVWQDGEFIEWVSLPSMQQNMDNLQQKQFKSLSEMTSELPPIFPLLSRRQALIAVAQGLLSIMPGRIRPYLNRFLYRLRPRVTRLITGRWTKYLASVMRRRSLIPAIAEQTPFPGRKMKKQLFSPGDVLISVGLDWDNNFYKTFYYLRKEQQVKVVTCCYDLIPVIYPQYCVGEVAGIFTSYFLEIADGSDLILCISKQTEKDLLEMLDKTGGAIPKTHVFPLGDNVPLADDADISPEIKQICKKPFILYVSTVERRKNHEVLYRAYHLLCAEGKREELPIMLFVGMQGWGVGDLVKDMELDPLTRDLIVRLAHVTDSELRVLYDAAIFCVFPSLYEGWGLPVGEALSMGKAILCSDRGSLPEVGSDLVRYVDPWSPREWAHELWRMSNDDIWRSEWELKAINRYVPRSWKAASVSVKSAIEDCF